MSDAREELRRAVQPLVEIYAGHHRRTEFERAAMLVVARARAEALRVVPCRKHGPGATCIEKNGKLRVVVLSRDPTKNENRLSDERDYCESCKLLAAAVALVAEGER